MYVYNGRRGYPQNAGVLVLVVIVFHGSGTTNWILKCCAVSSGLVNTKIYENVRSVKSTIVIYGGMQGHNCDTENKHGIGRM